MKTKRRTLLFCVAAGTITSSFPGRARDSDAGSDRDFGPGTCQWQFFRLQHSGRAGMKYQAATPASSASWLSVSPAPGSGPATIDVAIDPSNATEGVYTNSIIVTSAGAGPDHTVAPNEIVSLYLTDFSCTTAPGVSLNGNPVLWRSYSPVQINYAAPSGYALPQGVIGSYAVTVGCNGSTFRSFNGLNVATVVPGILTMTQTSSGQAALINSDGTVNGAANPAVRGSYFSAYVTGFGNYNPVETNGLKNPAAAATATVGGVPAAVLYAGSAPGATDGIRQINIQIPAGIAPPLRRPLCSMRMGRRLRPALRWR